MSDNFRQAADKLPTSDSTSKTLSVDKQNLVKSTSKARRIDPDAVGFSVKEMAEMLGMKRPTLADKLKAALSWDEFNGSGVALSAHKTSKVLYSVESWEEILADLNIGLPQQLKAENFTQQGSEQSSVVVDAEFVQPGAITTTVKTQTIAPLKQFELPELNLSVLQSDDNAITAQTHQYQAYTDVAISQLEQALTARFSTGVQRILKEQDNVLEALKARATGTGAAQLPNAGNPAQS